MTFIWVLIPLAAIALAGFSEYLKFKKTTSEIGTSTRAMERELEAAREHVSALTRRVQNLEAIVTSEAWDALERGGAPVSRGPNLLDQTLNPGEEKDGSAARAAQMARRLRD